MQQITKNILKQVYLPRPANSRKYDYGFLLVIGGSEYYTGAPALSAMAAFRAGIDMVKVLAPRRAADIIAGFSPNLSTIPFEGKWFDEEDVALALSHEKSAQAVAGDKAAVLIGGGLGRSPETQKAVCQFLQESSASIVIDADALHAVACDKACLKGKQAVLTPQAYEFFVLTGKDVKDLPLDEKAEIVKQEAAKLGAVIVLKGGVDIISDGKEVVLNETGCPFMTVGGTGDVLAGILAGFVAWGNDPFLAAQAATFLSGKAGEMAAKKFGPGMLATDVIDFIPEAIK